MFAIVTISLCHPSLRSYLPVVYSCSTDLSQRPRQNSSILTHLVMDGESLKQCLTENGSGSLFPLNGLSLSLSVIVHKSISIPLLPQQREKEREREREREKERQTDRQIDREKVTETESQRQSQRQRHRQRERERKRERGRQADRQKAKQMDTETDSKTERAQSLILSTANASFPSARQLKPPPSPPYATLSTL